MIITLTVKLTPESRQELIDKFGGNYTAFREHLETMIRSGSFGDPAKITVRWLLDSARWQDPSITVRPPQ